MKWHNQIVRLAFCVLFILFYVHADAQSEPPDVGEIIEGALTPAVPDATETQPAASPAADTAVVTIKDLDQFKTELLTEIKKTIATGDSAVQIGKLYIKKTKDIPLYHGYKPKNLTRKGFDVNFEKVVFTVQDGAIVDIQLTTDFGVFYNGKGPVGLTNIRFNQTDYLMMHDHAEGFFYIRLQDIVGFTGKPYISDDCVATLDTSNLSMYFKKDVGVNAVIDLRLYTDALALAGKKDNGLAQIDARAKFFVHQMTFNNTPLSVFHYVKGYINLSKFDSKANYTNADEQFSRTQLVQKSWLTAELSTSLLETWLIYKSLSTAYLDFGGGFTVSNFVKDADTSSIVAPHFFLETGALIKGNDNFGINISARIIWQYSPQVTISKQGYSRVFIRPGMELYWNPFGNKSSRIFTRLNYVFDTKNEAEKRSSFFQFQIGYSVLLSGLFK